MNHHQTVYKINQLFDKIDNVRFKSDVEKQCDEPEQTAKLLTSIKPTFYSNIFIARQYCHIQLKC